jgi:hypothetical protein
MPGNRCTFEEATTAIARMNLAWDSEDVTERQKFKELRLFRNSSPDHVKAAVARACRRFVRRPNLDELGQLIRDEQQGNAPVDPADLTPPAEVSAKVAEIRQGLAEVEDVVVTWRTDRSLSASVRDPAAGIVDVRLADGIWSCSHCRDEYHCHHVRAAQQVTGAVAS